MKAAALCVILILSTVFQRGHSASLNVNSEVMEADDHLQQEEYSLQETLFRTKRHSHLSICRFCCNCCNNLKSCGMCCRTCVQEFIESLQLQEKPVLGIPNSCTEPLTNENSDQTHLLHTLGSSQDTMNMKSIVLCLILILTTATYHRGLCAYIRENENVDSAAQLSPFQMETADMQEPSELLLRDKRHTGLHICTYCCKCCRNKGCGYCCRT
ncbi:hepcidin [Pyxicephalus adspersus]|uniref:hepcidin n=1 Tax=Pyxicephalus adspersus TaxID=30357 RepID=UPI003B5A7383